jgi:cell division protein FtsB
MEISNQNRELESEVKKIKKEISELEQQKDILECENEK